MAKNFFKKPVIIGLAATTIFFGAGPASTFGQKIWRDIQYSKATKDYEILNYSVSSTDIVKNEVKVPFNCKLENDQVGYINQNSFSLFNFILPLQVEAKGGKSPSKSPAKTAPAPSKVSPTPPPKVTPPTKVNPGKKENNAEPNSNKITKVPIKKQIPSKSQFEEVYKDPAKLSISTIDGSKVRVKSRYNPNYGMYSDSYRTGNMLGILLSDSNEDYICEYRFEPRYDYNISYYGGEFGDKLKTISFGNNLLTNDQNPNGYKDYKAGDGISIKKEYSNYTLVGDDPIFSQILKEPLRYVDIIPSKPEEFKMYGYEELRINQFYQFHQSTNSNSFEVIDGSKIDFYSQELAKINGQLNAKDNLAKIGGINVKVFIVEEGMEDFTLNYCIQMLGCNKNELILSISLDKKSEISKIIGYSWSSDGFKIGEQLNLKYLIAQKDGKTKFDQVFVIDFLKSTRQLVEDGYVRKEMKNFEYLRSQYLCSLLKEEAQIRDCYISERKKSEAN